MTIPPLQFTWSGEVFTPLRPALADRHFVVGETYNLVEHFERSDASHRHYFAAVAEAWASLPDDLLPEYPSPEHLRKKMLVKAGFADERSIVCASKAEAQRVAAFVKPLDEYAVVVVKEAVVRIYTAQSQSYRAMGKMAFADSKEKVLDQISALLGGNLVG